MQPAVQILNPLHDILDFVLVLSLNLAGLTNGNVDGELDGARRVGQPAGGDIRLRCEADSVLAGICGGEVEATRVAVPLGHNAVVIVEGLLDGDVHLQGMVDRVGAALGVDNFCLETAYLWFNHHVSLIFLREAAGDSRIPATRVSLGRSSKKHFVCRPSM